MTEFYDKKVYPRHWSFTIDANASTKYALEQDWPDYVKTIIGICVYGGGTNALNTALITNSNASTMFLSLQNASDKVFDMIRLDQLLFEFADASSNSNTSNRFYPVNIGCNDVNLNTSFIFNPTAVNAAICFGILYI